jgi:hypothetical protein
MPDRYVSPLAAGSDRITDEARVAVVAGNGASAEVSTSRVSAATDAASEPRTVTA